MWTRINLIRGWCLITTLSLGNTAADSTIYSGFLGCRFCNKVCKRDELCVNDELFGNCQRADSVYDDYKYTLTASQLATLENALEHLLDLDYTWRDLYAQCVLGNILLAFRARRSYDPDFCSQAGGKPLTGAEQEDLVQEAKLLIDQYLLDRQEAASDEDLAWLGGSYGERDGWPSAEKKDELVKIHKYQKSRKRQDWQSREDSLEYPDSWLPEERSSHLLTSILQKLQDQPAYPADSIPSYYNAYQDEGDMEPRIPAMLPSAAEEDEEREGEATELTGDSDIDDLTLTPDDAKLLGDLLGGDLDVSSLDSAQVARLLNYVDAMLKALGGPYDTKTPDVTEADRMEPASYDAEDMMYGDDKTAEKRFPMEDGDVEGKVPVKPYSTAKPVIDIVDIANFGTLLVKPSVWASPEDPQLLITSLAHLLHISPGIFSQVSGPDGRVNFHVDSDIVNASYVTSMALKHASELEKETGYLVIERKIGEPSKQNEVPVGAVEGREEGPKYFVLTFVLCGVIAGGVLAVIAIYVVKRHAHSKEKLAQIAATTGDAPQASSDYQDLCRQRMQSKSSEKPEPIHVASRVGSVSATEAAARSPSSRSSTSSWSEEPVNSNMDISTGHMVLTYMEDHLKNRDRLEQEWQALVAYEAEPNDTSVATQPANTRKNRYTDVLAYDHSRVVLTSATNVSGSDYINACTIMDHDPRNPAYIATQGPLPHTVADFWQMVWEQGSVVIVNLTRLTEDGVAMCHRYWPEEGSDLYHIYEVHLVSEHIWCEDYLVRSFYLKNLQTNETRTVTQFHFLTWPDLGVPASAKALLDFRRKVNKSYRGRSCPVITHCSDGVGRSGTYMLIDMVLNRMGKGAKEIDIAATLEHIRDQRMQMVKVKEQFEFALASVAEEVHAILKALPQ